MKLQKVNCRQEERAAQLGKMKQLIIVYVVVIVHLGATNYEYEYHVRPNQNLKEMIEYNLFPVTSNTKMVLMSGVHEVINTTKEGLWLGNIHAYMLTGESGPGATTIISCERNFTILFYYCEDVIISDITFKHCALAFRCTDDVTIARVRVIDSEFNYI